MLPKLHVALNVNKFEESVEFYAKLFGKQPVKHKPGYAKFDIDSPGVNLTLNQNTVQEAGALSHLGIQVESTEQVLEFKSKWQEQGLAARDEMGTDCCFALQDKVWVDDPDGNSWEVFVVHVGDTAPELETSKLSNKACMPIHSCCK